MIHATFGIFAAHFDARRTLPSTVVGEDLLPCSAADSIVESRENAIERTRPGAEVGTSVRKGWQTASLRLRLSAHICFPMFSALCTNERSHSKRPSAIFFKPFFNLAFAAS